MKTKEELYHKVYLSPRLPRVILKPNSQSGQQDQPDLEARKSSDHQSASGSPTWAIPKSSSFAKPLPRNNAQIVIYIGKLALCIVHVGDV